MKFSCKACSFECDEGLRFGAHIRKFHEGAKHYYETFEPRHCESCSKLIQYRSEYGKIRYPFRRFCDKKCSGVGRGFQRWHAHPDWKGGKTKHGAYVLLSLGAIPDEDLTLISPMLQSQAKVLEHRYIMAKHLGRSLTRAETVHHKNGVRHDNRIENLELWAGKHPPGLRAGDIECPCCGYTFDRYMSGRANTR